MNNIYHKIITGGFALVLAGAVHSRQYLWMIRHLLHWELVHRSDFLQIWMQQRLQMLKMQ